MTVYDELDKLDMEDDIQPLPEGWRIRDASEASRIIRRIKEERKRAALYIKAAQDNAAFYLAQASQRQERLDGVISHWSSYLYEWFRDEDKRELKASYAIDLPDGKLVETKPKQDYARDEEALLTYLRVNAPEYIKVKETVDWAALKAHLEASGKMAVLTDSGMVVEGVKVIERPPEFSVK